LFNPKRGQLDTGLSVSENQGVGRTEYGQELPPKIFKAMQGEFLEYVEGQLLTVRFPVKERYGNPFGCMRGGMIVAVMDNTLGPLSLLLLPPSITTYVNTRFIGSVEMTYEFIHATAFRVKITPMQVDLRAEVKSPGGKLLATCTSSSAVMRRLKG
jgi:acyl-coenzyme A thioesterase PaaI-like protein